MKTLKKSTVKCFFSIIFITVSMSVFGQRERPANNITQNDFMTVEIMLTPCSDMSSTLTAYNPKNSDTNYFANTNFQVVWHDRNGNILSTSINLDCVCGGTYIVNVEDMNSHEKTTNFIRVPPCGIGSDN